MAKRIRVIETSVYEYTPNLEADVYQEHQVLSIEDAMALDSRDVGQGHTSPTELSDDLPTVSYVWEIFDDGTG